MKKGHKENTDIEFDNVLDKVMTIFRFLHEKDIFERYCKLHLSRRLLFGRGSSDPAESNLVIKLKTECGYQFTSKLESMFTDIKMSDEIQKDFRDFLQEGNINLGVDFTVRVSLVQIFGIDWMKILGFDNWFMAIASFNTM